MDPYYPYDYGYQQIQVDYGYQYDNPYGYVVFDEYSDEESDYMDEEFEDEEYNEEYCHCLLLRTFEVDPEARSLDNIRQFDVYWIVTQVINALEVLVTEAEDFQAIKMKKWQKSLKDISKIINVGKKIIEKVKIALQMNLKKLLKLPDIAVVKILDFLLDEFVLDKYALEVVNFEEPDDNDKVRRILLKVYDYFCKVVHSIRQKLEDNRMNCKTFLRVAMEAIQLGELEEEDGNDWKEYFEIEEETVEDIWEDEELAHSFRELFVEHIS